jgi:predicted RNase H-like HicB family nuclease
MQQIILNEREDGYTIEVPARPALTSQGNTYREAVKKLIDAFNTMPASNSQSTNTFPAKASSGRRSSAVRGIVS